MYIMYMMDFPMIGLQQNDERFLNQEMDQLRQIVVCFQSININF